MSYIVDSRKIEKLKLHTADGTYVYSDELEKTEFNSSKYVIFDDQGVLIHALELELVPYEFRRKNLIGLGKRVIVPFIHMCVYDSKGGVIYARDTIAVVNHIPSSSNLTRLLLGSNTRRYKAISNDVTAGLGELYRNEDTLLLYTISEADADVMKTGYIVEEYLM